MNGRLVLLIATLVAFAHVWNANARTASPPLLATRHAVNPGQADLSPLQSRGPSSSPRTLPAGIYRVVDASGYVGVVAIPGSPARSRASRDLYIVPEQGTTRYYIRQRSPQTARQTGFRPARPR
jgi:hypothetical protein